MRNGNRIVIASAALAASIATVAIAGETVRYRYDAPGRLVKVERTGSVNNNIATSYSHDKANNRRTRTTTGAPN
jgi:YD repeat-containing protein